MSAADFVYLTMGVALVIYVLSAGADFGAGVWHLLARGPRGEAQRKVLEKAIAPIWEANHVWMIFIIVVMFTAFPRAFAVVSIAFHIPITLTLIGIVLRGAAFVFRAYGLRPDATRERYGRVFAWSSAVTPVFLGWVLAGMSSGAVVYEGNVMRSGYAAGWTTPYAMAVGAFALTLFAMLAAVYMTLETGGETQNDFRKRALATELAAAPIALATFLLAPQALKDNFTQSVWFEAVQILTAAAALTAIAALVRKRYRLARASVMLQVTLIVVGWGLAMRGDFVLGVVGIHNSGTQAATLPLLIGITLGGSLLLVPSLVVLFRAFKGAKA